MEVNQTYQLKNLEIKMIEPLDKFGNTVIEIIDPQKKTTEHVHYNEPGTILKGFHFNKYLCAK